MKILLFWRKSPSLKKSNNITTQKKYFIIKCFFVTISKAIKSLFYWKDFCG